MSYILSGYKGRWGRNTRQNGNARLLQYQKTIVSIVWKRVQADTKTAIQSDVESPGRITIIVITVTTTEIILPANWRYEKEDMYFSAAGFIASAYRCFNGA